MHVYSPGFAQIVHIPDIRQDTVSGEHFSRMLQK